MSRRIAFGKGSEGTFTAVNTYPKAREKAFTVVNAISRLARPRLP